LMSLVSIGFGQIYNGEVNRAIWLFLMYCALGVPDSRWSRFICRAG